MYHNTLIPHQMHSYFPKKRIAVSKITNGKVIATQKTGRTVWRDNLNGFTHIKSSPQHMIVPEDKVMPKPLFPVHESPYSTSHSAI